MATLGAWSFDGTGDVALDLSGNGNDFDILNSGGIRTTGHTGEGLTKISSDRPEIPMIGQTDNRTVGLWAKGTGEVWYIRWNSIDDTGLWGLLHLNGNIGCRARNASSVVNPGVPIPVDGEWHHYCGTYDGTTVKFYLDGQLVDQGLLAGPLRTDAAVLDLAEWSDSNTIIDELWILDEALDQPAVAELMGTPPGSESPEPMLGGPLSTSDTVRANLLSALSLTEPQPYSNVDLMYQVREAGGLSIITVVDEWSPAKQLVGYWLEVRDA